MSVAVDDIYFSYDGKLVLGGITMQVPAGAFVCILGESGCGKSTLLRLLAGLEHPNSGRVLVDDQPVRRAGLDRGMVFQDYGLFPWMTAGENITLALKQRFKRMTKAERRAEALNRLKEVELEESCFHKFPKELSGGMRQRCAIARAFGIDPPILLMDEPFGALDAVTRAKLQDLVAALWQRETRQRKTIFFVTHDVDEAILLATDIFIMGQSPSRIIYSHHFGGDKAISRESLYTDSQALDLRNNLIRIINKEIVLKCGGSQVMKERKKT